MAPFLPFPFRWQDPSVEPYLDYQPLVVSSLITASLQPADASVREDHRAAVQLPPPPGLGVRAAAVLG